MSEAFDWLMVDALIAQDATQTGPNGVMRTRKGWRSRLQARGLRVLDDDELLAMRWLRRPSAKGDAPAPDVA
jgi:hypothetical protein